MGPAEPSKTPGHRAKRLDPQKKNILPWKKNPDHPGKKIFCHQTKLFHSQNVEGASI